MTYVQDLQVWAGHARKAIDGMETHFKAASQPTENDKDTMTITCKYAREMVTLAIEATEESIAMKMKLRAQVEIGIATKLMGELEMMIPRDKDLY